LFAVRVYITIIEGLAADKFVIQHRALQPHLQNGGREEREFPAAVFALTAAKAI
jgi:uncharacterized NAD-dependent epimerase/dehydratase family protein